MIRVEEPPVEDILMARTLWPEQQKLYGHVFEVFAVAASQKGDIAASSCKAQEAKYADIIIWDLTKGQTTVPACRLKGHKLTIVQLEFSKCDQFLLSCSRDRQWVLYKREQDSFNFTLLKKEKDAHSRIIWGISWSHDSKLFATCSREKQHAVKIWHGNSAEASEEGKIGTLHSELPVNCSASSTAISFFPVLVQDTFALMVGQESGTVAAWSLGQNLTWHKIAEIPAFYGHSLSVRRIKFNRRLQSENDFTVATCASD